MLDTEKRSGIGRPLDPNYPTNRAIVAVAVLVGLVGGAVQLFITGSGLLDSLVWSVEAAGGVFLAWALSRELDPDNEMSAFVSAGLWILSLAVINAPRLLALLWFLWSLRIVNRTSGLAAKPLDSVLFLTLGSWLAFQTSGIYIVMTAVVFVLDGLLEPANRRQYIFAGLSALPGLALFLALDALFAAFQFSRGVIVPLVVIAILFASVIASYRRVEVMGDYTGEPLDPTRVRAAQLIALITALLVGLLRGISGVASLLPFWSAFLGLALFRIVKAAGNFWQEVSKDA
jgi:hypothetical protein